jgi:hypothetical protein
MVSWVMSTRKVNGKINFALGGLLIAEVLFAPKGKVWLRYQGLTKIECEIHPSVSAAMQSLHAKLREYPPEGYHAKILDTFAPPLTEKPGQ